MPITPKLIGGEPAGASPFIDFSGEVLGGEELLQQGNVEEEHLETSHPVSEIPEIVPTVLAVAESKASSARILLVDDSPHAGYLASLFLSQAGYTITLAENGQKAVDKFKAEKFDLVLMDIQMPVMDGYEATKQIRIFENKNRRVPTVIVALTAHDTAPEIEACRNAGCNTVLEKPIQEGPLLELVKSYLVSSVSDRINFTELQNLLANKDWDKMLKTIPDADSYSNLRVAVGKKDEGGVVECLSELKLMDGLQDMVDEEVKFDDNLEELGKGEADSNHLVKVLGDAGDADSSLSIAQDVQLNDALAAMKRRYIDDVREDLKIVRELVVKKDWEGIRRKGHTLQGVSYEDYKAIFGFARQLKRACIDEDSAAVIGVTNEIEAFVNTTDKQPESDGSDPKRQKV